MSDDSLRQRFHAAAAEPSEPLDWPRLAERGRRRRRRRRAVPAGLTVAVVVAGAIALPLAVISRSHGPQVLHGTGNAVHWSGPAAPGNHVPKGWQPVTYGDAQIAVPATWQVVDLDERTCPAASAGPEIALGARPPGAPACALAGRYLAQAQQAPTSAAASGATVRVDGVAVSVVAGATSPLVAGAQVTYAVPAFGVELTVAAPYAQSVLATLSPSARAVVSAAGLLPYTPAQWKPVQLGGVSLRVPPSWPVVGQGPVSCDTLSPWTPAPAANVGPRPPFVSCLATVSAQHFVPGVWIFASPAGASPSWGKVVATSSIRGGTVEVFAGDPAATWVPVLVTLSGHRPPVGLWLGVGTDGTLARDVVGSLQISAA